MAVALTIYDIAKRAGVSITTVSRVLNGKGEVSAKTRERIRTVLQESNYTPNQMARGLAGKSIRTIGVIAVDIRNVQHASLVYHAEQTLRENGYSAIVCNLGGNPQQLTSYLEMLISRQVDGFVFVGSIFAGPDYSSFLQDSCGGLPCVLVNASLPWDGFYSVLSEEEAGFADAVDYLIRQKDRARIVMIGNEETPSNTNKRRGYTNGMFRNGFEGEILFLTAPSTLEGGAQAVERLMPARPDTEAILFSEDIMAAGGMDTLLRMGRRVPHDVMVIGANNSIFTQTCHPTLTSIDNKPCETGRLVAKVLTDAIEGRLPLKEYRLRCELAVRESTDIEIYRRTAAHASHPT